MLFHGPSIKKLELPQGLSNKITNNLINKEFKIFLLKFILSFVTLFFGCFFIWKGIVSSSVLKFSFNNMSIELNTTLPGLILSLFSIILMLLSRLNIKIK